MTTIAKGLSSLTRGLKATLGLAGEPAADTADTPVIPTAKPARPGEIQPAALRMRSRKIGYLMAMDLFQDLDSKDMDWLERVTTMLTAEKGRVVYMPGETGEVLFLLKTGRVQIYRLSPDGQKLVIAILGPKTFFGEMSLLGQGMYDTYAETLEDATICAMSRNDLEQLISRHPAVALRILNIVGQRLVEAESMLEDLAFRSVPARIGALLVRLAERQGDPVVLLTHQELAEMAGTYRETVTVCLNQFKAEGFIELGRRQIVLLDIPGLQRAIQG